jgi:hypothetical protein
MVFTEALKASVRRKAHHSCCMCKSVGVEIHHIIPQEDDGPDTEENAAPLCPSCHEIWGGNTQKRKFIREARDLWYEICAKRFASDADRLQELQDSFEDMKAAVLERIERKEFARNDEAISAAIGKLLDQVWYNRHLHLKSMVESGKETVDAEVWRGALKSAKRVRKQMPRDDLPPYTDFEWGMLNGKLSALRWVMGDDWDMLDT